MLLTLLLPAAKGQSVKLLKDDGSSGFEPTIGVYEDVNGSIGLGVSSPAARLDIRGGCSASTIISAHSTSCGTPPDYFQAQRHIIGGPPSYTVNTITDFIIKGDGNTGIGTATPNAPLTLKCRNWWDEEAPFGEKMMFFTDPEDEIIGAFMNTGTGNSDNGGLFALVSNNSNTTAMIAAINLAQGMIPFAVFNNATAIGLPFEENPVAQFDIRKSSNPYDYLMNLSNADNTTTYLKVNNDGYVGIGVTPSSNARLALYNPGGDTRFDIIPSSGNNSAIRFMAHSNSQPRHIITEANGDFVIDPGISGGGGNDMLVVSGSERVTNKLIVGDKTITSGTHSDAVLFADGKIAAKACVVTVNNWADDVFKPDYELLTLCTLKTI